MSVNKLDGDMFTIYFNDLSREKDISIFISTKKDDNYDKLVRDNQCYIIVDKLDRDNVKNIFMNAVNALKNNGYSNISHDVIFVVQNNNELNNISGISFGDDFNVKFDDSFKNKKNTEEEKEEFIDRLMEFKSVTKIDNGIMRHYIQRKSDSNHVGYMLEDVDRSVIYDKYVELLNDSTKANEISGMSEEELGNYVLDMVSEENNIKKYYLESALDQKANDRMGAVAGRLAYQNDGVVNKEIGIVENGPDNSNQFNSVEEDDNRVNVITPQVNSNSMSSNGSSVVNDTNSYSDDNSYSYDGNSLDNNGNEYGNEYTEEEVQAREKSNNYVKKRVLRPNNKSNGIISLVAIFFILFVFYILFLIINFS